MPQIPDSEKLSRIRISLEAYDRGEIGTAMFTEHVRWALDQEAVSDADVELASEEARAIRPMIEPERNR